MTNIVAYKKGKRTLFYDVDYFDFDSPDFYLIEENGAFLLSEPYVDLDIDDIIGLYSSEEDMKEGLLTYCKKNKINKDFIYTTKSPLLSMNIYETLYNDDSLSMDKFKEISLKEEDYINNINNVLQDLKSFFIEPIYREYSNRKRKDKKKVMALEEFLELTIDDNIEYGFFDIFHDNLGDILFFINKDEEFKSFITTYISSTFIEYHSDYDEAKEPTMDRLLSL